MCSHTHMLHNANTQADSTHSLKLIPVQYACTNMYASLFQPKCEWAVSPYIGGCSLHYNPDYSWTDILNYYLPQCISYILTSVKRAVCHFSERGSEISVKCQTPTVFASTNAIYCVSHFRDVAHTLEQIVVKADPVPGENPPLTCSLVRKDNIYRVLFLDYLFLFYST